jgi:hypothetical protein
MNDHIHELLLDGVFVSMRLPTVLTLPHIRVCLTGFSTALQRILADIDPWWRARRGRELVNGLRSDDIPHCHTDTSSTFLLHIREHCDQDEDGHLDTLKWSVIAEYLRFILEKSILTTAPSLHATLHDIDVQIEFFRDYFGPSEQLYDTVQMFLDEQAEAAGQLELPIGGGATAEAAGQLELPIGGGATADSGPTEEEKKTNGSVRKMQEIIDALSRGEKPELNEGDYLEISNDLKNLYVS